jgi:hypothetical protein
MTTPPEDTLIIFSRFPRAGVAKTRLIPVLGADGAAELQRQMTEHTLAGALRLCERQPLQIEINYEGDDQGAMENWLGPQVSYRPQSDGDIGNRMQAAISGAFAKEAARVVLIGSDIPGISTDILERAFRALGEHDLVIGPATDGGYYLIGMNKRSLGAARDVLFDGIEWSSHRVLAQTTDRAASIGASIKRLEALSDVDQPTDLPVWTGRRRQHGPGPKGKKISVVIPTLNEADHIEKTLAAALNHSPAEIIVIDGGSTDGTDQIALTRSAIVYQTPPGKAAQMNAGAALASNDILLFLHADTCLPKGYTDLIKAVVNQPGVSAGAFRLGIDSPGSRLRFIEMVANLRSRFLQLPYGDQALFMTAETFGAVGGFPVQPIMEDFELIRRLRRRGKIALAPGMVRTSPRRWHNMGVLRTWLINQRIVSAYLAGVSPHRLAAWYRREKGKHTRQTTAC